MPDAHDWVPVTCLVTWANYGGHPRTRRRSPGSSTETPSPFQAENNFVSSSAPINKPPNPNIRAWLPGWSHHPSSSASHMPVRSPAALRLVIARFTALHFFHPLSALSYHWLNRNLGPSSNMDNFNRHFPIRPDALVSSRARTLIRRGLWLMQASPHPCEWCMDGASGRRSGMKSWIFFLLIVSSGLEGWDLYRCSYCPFPCFLFLRPIDPILGFRFD